MPNDPKRDLEIYQKLIADCNRDLAICVEIEKRYGLHGLSAQDAHRALARLSKQQSQKQEPAPNVQNNQT